MQKNKGFSFAERIIILKKSADFIMDMNPFKLPVRKYSFTCDDNIGESCLLKGEIFIPSMLCLHKHRHHQMDVLFWFTLQGTDTYPTKREVRNIIIDSKVPASSRGSRVRVRSRGHFNNKKTKHQGVSLSICTSSGITTRNLKSLYQRRCDLKIKQKKKDRAPFNTFSVFRLASPPATFV